MLKRATRLYGYDAEVGNARIDRLKCIPKHLTTFEPEIMTNFRLSIT